MNMLEILIAAFAVAFILLRTFHCVMDWRRSDSRAARIQTESRYHEHLERKFHGEMTQQEIDYINSVREWR